ncbi:hypothetical protein [uncultured Helicobacter sp.]|uniref:hypothetical protein n=1 Tax=uncultured Helicobacter sp. TaxID=175537 RepID=UPI00374E253C
MKLSIVMIMGLGIMFFGCAGHNYDPNKDYSFNANPSEIVQNPKQGESRIYVYRPSMTGVLVSYDITLHTTDDVKDNFRSGYFVGKSRSSSAFYVDIVPNGESIVLSAKTEARKTFDFMPQPNRIYCVLSGLSMGFLWVDHISLWWIKKNVSKTSKSFLQKKVCNNGKKIEKISIKNSA